GRVQGRLARTQDLSGASHARPSRTESPPMLVDVNATPAYAYTGGRPFDPSRPVVVFIHGAEHDHSVWALQSRYLAHHGFAVLALDLPGHGRSGGAAIGSVEALAD